MWTAASISTGQPTWGATLSLARAQVFSGLVASSTSRPASQDTSPILPSTTVPSMIISQDACIPARRGHTAPEYVIAGAATSARQGTIALEVKRVQPKCPARQDATRMNLHSRSALASAILDLSVLKEVTAPLPIYARQGDTAAGQRTPKRGIARLAELATFALRHPHLGARAREISFRGPARLEHSLRLKQHPPARHAPPARSLAPRVENARAARLGGTTTPIRAIVTVVQQDGGATQQMQAERRSARSVPWGNTPPPKEQMRKIPAFLAPRAEPTSRASLGPKSRVSAFPAPSISFKTPRGKPAACSATHQGRPWLPEPQSAPSAPRASLCHPPRTAPRVLLAPSACMAPLSARSVDLDSMPVETRRRANRARRASTVRGVDKLRVPPAKTAPRASTAPPRVSGRRTCARPALQAKLTLPNSPAPPPTLCAASARQKPTRARLERWTAWHAPRDFHRV